MPIGESKVIIDADSPTPIEAEAFTDDYRIFYTAPAKEAREVEVWADGYAAGYLRGASGNAVIGKFEARQTMVTGQRQLSEEPKEVRLAEAKIAIKAFFEEHHGEIIDYTDLTEAFDMPLHLIVEACDELETEGKIAGVD